MWAGEDGEGEATVDGDGHEGGKLEADRNGREEPNGLRGGGGQETFFARR